MLYIFLADVHKVSIRIIITSKVLGFIITSKSFLNLILHKSWNLSHCILWRLYLILWMLRISKGGISLTIEREWWNWYLGIRSFICAPGVYVAQSMNARFVESFLESGYFLLWKWAWTNNGRKQFFHSTLNSTGHENY